MRDRRQISPKQHEWLRREAAEWAADGLVDPAGAATIVERYTPTGRPSAIRLVSVLGAAFVGVGLISLVASNLDEMPPLLRFCGIAVVWLAAVGIAEALQRRGGDTADTADDEPSLAVGAARLIATAAYGATIFQAAQSLQVPAYSPLLLLCWSGGALAYAYACRGVGPLLVGVTTLVGWYVWIVGERADDAAPVVVGLLVGAVVCVAAGAAHDQRGPSGFAPAWSYAGALLALVAMFAAALPDVGRSGLELPRADVAGIAVAAAVGVGAALISATQGRREIAAVTAMLAAGILLVAWAPEEAASDGTLRGPELLRAAVGTVLYLATAVWIAVVGAVRARPQLTNLATAGLALFVTVQSFGVFAPLLSGAALFLVLGVVLIAGGLLADRGRRRIVEEVAS